MAPPRAAAAGGRGQWRGRDKIPCGAVGPTAMVEAGEITGQENLGGGSGPMAFLGLTDSTQLARLAPDPQGVAGPTNRENEGGVVAVRHHNQQNDGEGVHNPPPTERKRVRDRQGWKGTYRWPTHN